MECFLHSLISWIPPLTDNASFATVSGIMIATFIAKKAYREQKNLDREYTKEDELINKIIQLQAKVGYVILLLNRIASSYEITQQEENKSLEGIIANEIPLISQVINDEIPMLLLKISSDIDLFFKNKSGLEDAHISLKETVNRWHHPIVYMKINLRIKTDLQPEISPQPIYNAAKDLIHKIHSA